MHYKDFREVYGKPLQRQHVPSENKPNPANKAAVHAKFFMTCSACAKPRVLFKKADSSQQVRR